MPFDRTFEKSLDSIEIIVFIWLLSERLSEQHSDDQIEFALAIPVPTDEPVVRIIDPLAEMRANYV